jgi:hypothetical protein
MSLCRPVLPAVRAVHRFLPLALAALIALAFALPATAQIIRGVDSAYDPANDVYLVVSGHGPVKGVFVNRSGVAVTAPFTIAAGSAFGSFPRAVYSPHANSGKGAFLVVWAAEANKTAYLKGRMVRYPGTLLGTEQNISSPTTTWGDFGAVDAAYSTTSQRFLVAWQSMPPRRIVARFVDNNAAPIGSALTLSATHAQDPGVTWNASTNEFGVSFSGEAKTTAYSAFVRIPATNLGAAQRTTFNELPTSALLTKATDIAYSPVSQRYIMGWFEFGPSGSVAKAAEISASGTVVATRVISTQGSYDAFSLDANPVSGTLLFATLNRSNDGLHGGELNSRGVRFAAENALSPSFRPVRYPRVAPNPEAREWLVTFSGSNFAQLARQAVSTSASNGGPSGAAASSLSLPAATQTTDYISFFKNTSSPPSGGTGGATGGGSGCPGSAPVSGWVCVNGGWLPPDHPLAKGSTPTTPPPTTPPPTTPPPTTTPKCAGSAPVSGWVCVTGGAWVPPDHPLAKSAGSTGGGTTTPPPSSCTTQQPGSGWVCVNGNWLPPDQAGLPNCTGSQLTGRPAAGWYRLADGGWVPESHPLAKTAVCKG